jgi:hypothetical protein
MRNDMWLYYNCPPDWKRNSVSDGSSTVSWCNVYEDFTTSFSAITPANEGNRLQINNTSSFYKWIDCSKWTFHNRLAYDNELRRKQLKEACHLYLVSSFYCFWHQIKGGLLVLKRKSNRSSWTTDSGLCKKRTHCCTHTLCCTNSNNG